jgi:ATP-dependent DNA ligase
VDSIASSEIWPVATWIANNEDEVKAHHDTWVQQGYEGAMIRLLHGKYAAGARSRELLKVKEFDETEYKFMFWEYGQREEDLIAVCSSASGEFRAKMIGTKTEKLELAKHPSHTGMITIKHFGLTEDGFPRFPIGKAFRDEL